MSELPLEDVIAPSGGISIWPLAPGWWLLIIGLTLTIAAVTVLALRWRKRTALKRQALKALTAIENKYTSDHDGELVSQISRLIRAAAIQKQPTTAAITGKNWAEWLNQTGNTNGFTHGVGCELIDNRYAKQINLNGRDSELLLLTRHWIKQAL